MVLIDLMLLAGITAAFLFTLTSVFLQRKYKLFTHILPTKYGTYTYIALLSLAWAQVVALTVVDYVSRWSIVKIWPVGVLLCAFGLWLIMTAVYELGVGSVYHMSLFNKKIKMPKKLYKRYAHPFYAGVVLSYAGFAFLFGRLGYMCAAGLLLCGFLLLSYIEQPLQFPRSTKQ